MQNAFQNAENTVKLNQLANISHTNVPKDCIS